MAKITTIRPGLLVAIKTSVTGNVSYLKKDISSQVDESTRTVMDADEQDKATKARSAARALISGICSKTSFGYLCPEVDRPALEERIEKAQKVVSEFNKDSVFTKINFFVVPARIADTDEAAIKAINSEVRELLDQIDQGIQNLDVKVIREAAGQVKQLGQMLTPETQARLNVGIDAVRAMATQWVKAGETAAKEIDRTVLRRLQDARTAFLDLDGQAEVQAPAAQGRGVDLEPSSEQVSAPAEPSREVEFG